MKPFIRHMLLCEEVRHRPGQSHKFDLLGFISAFRPRNSFPVRVSFTAFLVMTEGRGSGDGKIRIVDDVDSRILYDGPSRRIIFGNDPIEVIGMEFRVRQCIFEKPGLYWVEFEYNGERLMQQPLLIKELL